MATDLCLARVLSKLHRTSSHAGLLCSRKQLHLAKVIGGWQQQPDRDDDADHDSHAQHAAGAHVMSEALVACQCIVQQQGCRNGVVDSPQDGHHQVECHQL